jgi:hypothetical protein
MKPGKNDIKVTILISGNELIQLKRHTLMMDEAFGLDARIEKYQGTRPIGFYRWDLDCLIDVIDSALADEKEYPNRNAVEYLSLQNLHNRLNEIYEKTYD